MGIRCVADPVLIDSILIGTDGSSNWGTDDNKLYALTFDGENDYGFAPGYKGITGSVSMVRFILVQDYPRRLIKYGSAGTGTLFKVTLNGTGEAGG